MRNLGDARSAASKPTTNTIACVYADISYMSLWFTVRGVPAAFTLIWKYMAWCLIVFADAADIDAR